MNRYLGFLFLALALLLACTDSSQTQFTTVSLTKEVIEETISSTGSLQAVGTVEIGTQVSGTVSKVLADFNGHVGKGQVLAELDRTALQANCEQVQASLAKAQAQANKSKLESERAQKFFDQGNLSEKDLSDAKTTAILDQSSVTAAQAALRLAEINLAHATIRSPIDGTVISRSIEVGQTVAASLSTPTLFVIAEDLSKMEILANVDESDIGIVKPGQVVRFTVQTYPDSSFQGTVRQVRLQGAVVQNVVNYTVVVDAPNPQQMLLPGMTATLEFLVRSTDSVLAIPNSAMGFKPSTEILAKIGAPPTPRDKEKSEHKETNSPRGIVWMLDSNGKLVSHSFKSGISNGSHTEVTHTRDLKVGDRVITGVATDSAAKVKKKGSLLDMGPGGHGGGPH
jgi:HlyD family secretion protein